VRLDSNQGEVLGHVPTRCAESIANGGLLHLFGSGHSVIPTLETFPRCGSFVGLYLLNDPRLMWHNVLGPGGFWNCCAGTRPWPQARRRGSCGIVVANVGSGERIPALAAPIIRLASVLHR
jgi:uncharacterized phosphosugar-binding protein